MRENSQHPGGLLMTLINRRLCHQFFTVVFGLHLCTCNIQPSYTWSLSFLFVRGSWNRTQKSSTILNKLYRTLENSTVVAGTQRCGSGIRAPEIWVWHPGWVSSGSRIPNPYFSELGKKMFVRGGTSIICQFKISKFCEIYGCKKKHGKKFFLLFLLLIRGIQDPGWEKIKIRDIHFGSATLLILMW